MAKKKNRTIGFQLENAINSAFGKEGKGGADKHSMRKNGQDTTSTVFSYKERAALLKIGYQLGNYLKDNYPKVEQVADIAPPMIQSFLNHKANSNNSNSLVTIKSSLSKLDKVSSKRFESKTASFMVDVKKPKTECVNNIRKNVNTTKNDWEKIEQAMEGSRSKANILIRLAKEYGMRVEALTNMRVSDFDFANRIVHIVDDKGGRDRTISMTNVDICRGVCGTLGANERITKLRPSSVNKQFGRLTEKAGINAKYKDAKTGIHSLRKQAACDLACDLRAKGMDREDILSTVSKWLGHGTSRRDVLKKYLNGETIDYISK